jgi:hypothetical protein
MFKYTGITISRNFSTIVWNFRANTKKNIKWRIVPIETSINIKETRKLPYNIKTELNEHYYVAFTNTRI